MVKLEGKKGKARVALLTVTIEEFAGVQAAFGLNVNLPGTPYYVSEAHHGPFEVVGRRAPGQTNVISEKAAGDLVEDFRPEFLILIGTAGSCQARGVRLGDVVVADYVDYSGYWKFANGRVLHRKNPHDHPSFFLHEGFVERLRVEPNEWRHHIAVERPPGNGEPTLHVGNLVSGDLLLGDIANAAQQHILDYFDKAIAFEMEGFGVARALFQSRRFVYYNPQFLIIRGISDFVDVAEGNVETRRQWTKYAVSAATAVAYALVQRLAEDRRRSRVGFFKTMAQKFSDWMTPDA